MLRLSKKWAESLISKPETGMGYQIASITLLNGKHYDEVIIDSGFITRIGDNTKIPFNEEDIANIVVEKRGNL
jgi:hypothetical protein